MEKLRKLFNRPLYGTAGVVLLLILLTLLFFRHPLLGDRVWADGPSVFSSYPWKTYSSYRDVEQRIELDNARYYLPNQLFLVNSIFERGEFPLWNPYILAGTPFFASANKHTLALTNLVYAFFEFSSAINWSIALQVFFSGFFMFLYIRYLLGQKNTFPAIAGALLFMFSGDLIERTFILSIEELMWMPLALFALHRTTKSPFRIWPFVCIGLILSLIYLGGHEFNTPVLYVLFASVWAATCLHYWKRWPRGFRVSYLGGSILIVIVCIGLSGIKLFPSVENYLLSARLASGYPIDVDFTDSTFPALVKQTGYVLFNLFFPIHIPLIMQAFGGNLFYFGFFGIMTIIWGWRRIHFWPGKMFLGFSLIGLFVAISGRFIMTNLTLSFGELKWVSILRPYVQHHNQALVTTVCVPIVASIGLKYLMEKLEDSAVRIRFVKSLGLMTLGLGLIGVIGATEIIDIVTKFSRDFTVWMTMGVAASSSMLVWLWQKQVIKNKHVWVGILALIAIELGVMVRLPFHLPTHQDFYPKTKTGEFLTRQSGLYRIAAFQDFGGPWSWFTSVMPPNTAMMEEVEDIRGWSNFMLRRHAQFFSGIENSNLASLDKLYRNRIDLYRNDAWFRWFDLLNVRFVMISNDEDDLLEPENFRLVQSGEDRIHENTNVLPRAFVVNKNEIEKDPRKAIARLNDTSFNFRENVILEESLPTSSGLIQLDEPPENSKSDLNLKAHSTPRTFNFESTAEIISYRANEVILRVATNGPGILFLANSYHPGWRAYVDGKGSQVLPTNLMFQGVTVPKGEHEVRLRFLPRSFVLGFIFSAGTVVFILIIAISSLWRWSIIRNS